MNCFWSNVCITKYRIIYALIKTRDGDPHSLHTYQDPDPYSRLMRIRIPLLVRSDANLRPLVYRPFMDLFWASTLPFVTVHGPTRLHSEPLKLLYIEFNKDPEPAFHYDSNADPDPPSQNNTDPNPQTWIKKEQNIFVKIRIYCTMVSFFFIPSFSSADKKLSVTYL